MVQLLEKDTGNLIASAKHALSIAASLCKEFAETAMERDAKGGVPEYEAQRLRESGLLSLVIPKKYGGIGATWPEAVKVVRELCKADGSIGQLFATHLTLTIAGHASGTPEQKERFYRETARNNWFWANAATVRDTRLKIALEGDKFRVNGVKGFGTGVAVADMRLFSAFQEGVAVPVFFVIPKDREGVISNNDWNNMGQRRTDSGSLRFDNVLVRKDEILGPPSPPDSAFPTIVVLFDQLMKTQIYLGIAQGALEAAREYTSTITRPWITSGVESATQDPYILRHYGELWTELEAAISLADKAVELVQAAWEKDVTLTHEERGEAAITVFAAKTFATKVGLDITTRIFEVMGARSTAKKYGFDRYWREMRTLTLHDPVDYKLREVGNWVLNHELPTVTAYS